MVWAKTHCHGTIKFQTQFHTGEKKQPASKNTVKWRNFSIYLYIFFLFRPTQPDAIGIESRTSCNLVWEELTDGSRFRVTSATVTLPRLFSSIVGFCLVIFLTFSNSPYGYIRARSSLTFKGSRALGGVFFLHSVCFSTFQLWPLCDFFLIH